MQKKTLIIISTPLQTICAIEAIFHYNYTLYEILVLYTKNNRQLNSGSQRLLDDRNIRYKILEFNSYFDLCYQLLTTKSSIFHRILIGEYYSAAQRLISGYWGKYRAELIYIDDGNATFSIFEHRYPLLFPLKIRNYAKLVLPCLLYLIKGFNRTFFTMYNVNSKKRKIEKNKLEFLNFNVSNNVAYGIFIIGTNTRIINTMLRHAKYENYLKTIVTHYREIFPEEKIYYSPHRMDYNNKELLQFCEILDISILTSQVSVEIDYLVNGYNPKLIIGFGSSALLTLKNIFPKTHFVTVFMTFKSYQDNDCYRKIEHQYLKEGITILEIENEIASNILP